jgi:hypothetical protein
MASNPPADNIVQAKHMRRAHTYNATATSKAVRCGQMKHPKMTSLLIFKDTGPWLSCYGSWDDRAIPGFV